MLLERREGNDLQGLLMGGGQHHVRSGAIVMSPQPVRSRHTPPVAGHQPRELVLGHRGGQVVANTALVLQELGGHDRADSVAALVLRPGATATVSIEPGDRVATTRLQLTAEHIAIMHLRSIGVPERA